MGKRNKSNLEQSKKSKNETQSNVFSVVLFYCLLIIIAPIVTFFSTKYFVFDSLLEAIPSNIWSAISSIIALHLALGLFLYRAYFNDEVIPQNRKQD